MRRVNLLEYKIEGKRSIGRLRLQWEYCIWKDVQKLGVKNWWMNAKDNATDDKSYERKLYE